MKTARFSQLVKQCGKPESYLVLMEPAQDRALQAAVKAQRVLTVTQATVGAKADYGEVGFKEGGPRQYLLFPKSLRNFIGRKIVGVNYELLSHKELPASKRAPAPRLRQPKKAPRHTKDAGKVRNEKVIPFQAPPDKEEAAPKEKVKEPTIKELKRLAKQAMRALKAGKQVAAFELLKKMAQD